MGGRKVGQQVATEQTTETLAPSERRDRARSRAAEVAAKVQVLDALLATVTQQEAELDARLRQGEAAVKHAWGTVAGQRSALVRAKAAASIDETASDKVAEAEQRVAEAEAALTQDQANVKQLAASSSELRDRLTAEREQLTAERTELAGLVAALQSVAEEAHRDHGRERLAAAKADKAELVARISAARSELSAASSALDELHHQTAPSIGADHPELVGDLQAEGIVDPRHASRDILTAFSCYLDALERHAGRLSEQQAGMLPYALSPAYYYSQETLRNILHGDVQALKLLRSPVSKAVGDLAAAEATAAAATLRKGA